MIKSLLGIVDWYHPRLIPNRSGYKFVAQLVDQTIVDCETYVSDFNIRMAVRTVESKTSIPFVKIDQWREV